MPTIIVRSSWQTVNIGDIGHTPGLLRLLETHLPVFDLVLWANHLDRGVGEMLARDFPAVRCYESGTDESGRPDNAKLLQEWLNADCMLHGSGPYIVAKDALQGWIAREDPRPFGVYGISLESPSADEIALLSQAAFVFFRDSISLENTRQSGLDLDVMAFAPDATFAGIVADESSAEVFLEQNHLNDQPFLCVVPRLRQTPYFKMEGRAPTDAEARKAIESETHKEGDHAKLRAVMESWIRTTGHPVLICPEMTYQIELGREMLLDRIDPDLRDRVILRENYWTPDEAVAVYAASTAVVSFEMHSPILALSAGIPALYLRQPTDTCKGQMWRDIGLPEWIFEIDEVSSDEITSAINEMVASPETTSEKVASARLRIDTLQIASMRQVADAFNPSATLPKVNS